MQTRDTGDTLLATVSIRERFLAAYEQVRTVAGACRLAHIHRSTVYRWCYADVAFVLAMDAAWERGYQRWRREVYEPQERVRQAARERRNAELHEQRVVQAAHMRRRSGSVCMRLKPKPRRWLRS